MDTPTEVLPATRIVPRLLLTKRRAAVIVVVLYLLALVVMRSTFSYIEWVQAYEDDRDDVMMQVLGVAVAILCAVSLLAVVRRARPANGS